MHKRTTEAQKVAMEHYLRNTTATYREIAAQVGLCKDTVRKFAASIDVRRKRGPRPNAAPVPVYAAIVAYEQQGLPIGEIAKRMKLRRHRVAAAMEAAGFARRPTNWSKKASLTDLLRMRRAGLSIIKIARRVGLHPSTVRVRFERHDAKHERQEVQT
jgi:IS30 family transposase